MNRTLNLLALALILALFFLAYSASAQGESTPEPTPVVVDAPAVVDVSATEALPSWASELAYGTLLITALIGLGKYIPALNKIPLARQKIVLVLLLLVVHLYAKENGDLGAFSAKITSLGELASRLVAFAGMYAGSSLVHESAGNLPMLGNSRPTPPKPQQDL